MVTVRIQASERVNYAGVKELSEEDFETLKAMLRKGGSDASADEICLDARNDVVSGDGIYLDDVDLHVINEDGSYTAIYVESE